MRYEVKQFSGIRPAKSSDLLQPGEAESAVNTRLTSGALAPYNTLGALVDGTATFAAGTKALYKFGHTTSADNLYWFQSTSESDFVRGPVKSDTLERTYWTTDGSYPRKTNDTIARTAAPYPSNSYRMGVPAPASAGAPTLGGTPTNAADPVETVIYCMTYVTAWGEEGPPSPVTTTIDIRPGNTVSFASIPVVPTGTYNSSNTNIVGKRLYRSATGSSSTKFQLVNTEGDIAVATTTYTDSKLTKNLGDVLVTTGWIAPPDDMIGLVDMANGILAGFTGNTLCFSEPFAPYAWPVRYQQALDAPIVGIMGYDQSLFVGTSKSVHVFTGSHPGQMTSEQLPVTLALIARRSLVKMLGGVTFAAQNGLFLVSSGGVRNLTESYMTAQDWQAITPTSIRGYEFNGRYYGFSSTLAYGFALTFGDSPSLSTLDTAATAGYRDTRSGTLYLLVGGVLVRWDAGGTAMTQTWVSGTFNAPYPINMSCARVLAATYPLNFYVYYDDGAPLTVTVSDQYPFRLPDAPRVRRVKFGVQGATTIREVVMATSMSELGRGDTSG